MHKPSIVTKSLSLVLGLSLALGGGACMQELDSADSELRSGMLLGLNTLEDPLFATPLLVDTYFDAVELGAGNAELATNPAAVFGRQQVVFGQRVWNRVAAGEFVLAGTDGQVSIKVPSDATSIVVKSGDRFVPIAIVGTLPERAEQAGFLAVLGMSGVEPSDDVLAPMPQAGLVIAGIVLVGTFALAYQAQGYFWCERLAQQCADNAIRMCTAGGGYVISDGFSCNGEGAVGSEEGSAGVAMTCDPLCGGGGGTSGGGGTGIPTTTTDGDAGDDGGDDSGGEGGEDAGGDDGGDGGDGGDGDSGGDETGGCDDEEQGGYWIGAIATDNGIAVFAGADDTNDGGETGGC